MIQYSVGTVFNAPAEMLVNTVNCVGVMGSGIALEFRLRYPQMYEDYVDRCARKSITIGRPYTYRIDSPHTAILNFPTKTHFRYPSKISWIAQGLQYFSDQFDHWGVRSAAFPQLGCGRGGLNWVDVQPVMESWLTRVDADIWICLDTDRHASGLEAAMVDMVNSATSGEWLGSLKLRRDIESRIEAALPIRRFRELAAIPGVGGQTYEALFQLFYARATMRNMVDHQVAPVQPRLL